MEARNRGLERGEGVAESSRRPSASPLIALGLDWFKRQSQAGRGAVPMQGLATILLGPFVKYLQSGQSTVQIGSHHCCVRSCSKAPHRVQE